MVLLEVCVDKYTKGEFAGLKCFTNFSVFRPIRSESII